MRKPIIVIIAFLLVAAVMIPTHADITGHTWLGTVNNGSIDPYYDQSTHVYAYKEGAPAVVAITVTNNNATSAGKGFNVTSVYVSFDWGTTYTSSQVSTTNPIPLPYGQSRVFFVSFTVPNVTTTVSNQYQHSYTIYATYKWGNATVTVSGTYMSIPYNDFVVYSEDQADAADLVKIIDNFPSLTWQSAKAKILSNMADNETATGDFYYAEGDFANAKRSYSAALGDLNSAMSAEQDYLSIYEDLQIGEFQAEINGMNAWASFLNGFSTLWVLIGIGWVLLGIGYIIKWLRTKKPETPAAQA
jgi:hypothetical protein